MQQREEQQAVAGDAAKAEEADEKAKHEKKREIGSQIAGT